MDETRENSDDVLAGSPAPIKPAFEPPEDAPPSRLLAYLQLLRLPNVFTAMADVLLGYLVTHGDLSPPAVFACLLGSSSLLYLSGMALNDVFDREQDARERPTRPIPSGRVPLRVAQAMGWLMLLVGATLGWLAGCLATQWRAGVVASCLAAAVVLYDAVFKRTPLGPLGMGACRMLNVLLGASTVAGPLPQFMWVLAGGMGIYIAGVTWFARTEAVASSRPQLAAALSVMLAGLAVIAWYPYWSEGAAEIAPPSQWPIVWAIFGLIVANRCLRAVFDPRPATVQVAVKMSILAIVVIDAMACFGALGQPFWPMIIVSLLLPTLLLGRWVYST